MPQNYKRKKDSPKIPVDQIIKAVEECKNGDGIRKIALKYNIPKTTLNRYLKSDNWTNIRAYWNVTVHFMLMLEYLQ